MKRSKRKKFFSFYLGALIITTIAFGGHIIHTFYLIPSSSSKTPYYGSRVELLEPIADSQLRSTMDLALSQAEIDGFTIDFKGETIYFDIRVTNDTTVETSQAMTEEFVTYFADELGPKLENYHLQLVITSGDIQQLHTQNKEASLASIKDNHLAFMELITSHAEKFPTLDNIGRVQININHLGDNHRKKIKRSYPELETFQARIDQLTPYTMEEEKSLDIPSSPEIKHLVEQTNLADYPSWGTYSPKEKVFNWN